MQNCVASVTNKQEICFLFITELRNLKFKRENLLVKSMRKIFFSNFVAFSQNLDFNNEKLQKYLVKSWMGIQMRLQKMFLIHCDTTMIESASLYIKKPSSICLMSLPTNWVGADAQWGESFFEVVLKCLCNKNATSKIFSIHCAIHTCYLVA